MHNYSCKSCFKGRCIECLDGYYLQYTPDLDTSELKSLLKEEMEQDLRQKIEGFLSKITETYSTNCTDTCGESEIPTTLSNGVKVCKPVCL